MQTLHIYTRVSGKQQIDNFSLGGQKREGIKYAERFNMPYKVHVEPGLSAKHDDIENRPVLKELIKACVMGNVKHIFVTESDRLTRSGIVQMQLNAIFAKNGVVFHTLANRFDLNESSDNFMSSMFALIAQKDNADRVIKVKRGLLDSSKQGRWTGGVMLPYGYMRDEKGFLVVCDEEKEAYLEMVDWSISGIGTRTIATRLNDKGVSSRAKKALINGFNLKYKFVSNDTIIWRDAVIYNILRNPIYKGERRYKGTILKAPAIIDSDVWDKLQKALSNRSKTRIHTYFFLLKGLLRCGVCGDNMYGKSRIDKKDHFYMCVSKRYTNGNCGNRSIGIDGLDSAIWINVIVRANSYLEALNKHSFSADEAILKKKMQDITGRIKEYEKRKKNLIILFEQERLSLSQYDERCSDIDSEISNFNKKYLELKAKKQSVSENSEVDKIKNMLKKFSIFCNMEEQRDLLLSVVNNITITHKKKERCHNISLEMKFMDPIIFDLHYVPGKKTVVFLPPQLTQ